MATFGAFVELAEGIEGLCHVSEIEEKRRKHEEGQQRPGPKPAAGTTLEAGKEYDFKIVKLDPDQHRIGLSFRAALKQAEKREMDEYRSSKSSSTATIGDVILSKGRSL
jgi:small subunit ribosomal protein S1